ncbi:aberrant root formation protein 4-like isoform X1 [Miscanthus floridulus]|uniref:aberrant root formation protein 4-like isoform X1 n=1 Tax=Miscanthus floridulus TaxID=154761 RepID=UPI003457C976
MAAVEPSAATTSDAPISYSPAAPYSARLREALTALSEACDSGNSNASETASFTISDILDTAAVVSAEADDGSDDSEDASRPGASEELLREVLEFLSRPSSISNQMALDALSLVLPKPVAKLGAQMGRCRDVAAAILKFFVSNCSPRDMLSILCEALDASMELPNGLSSFVLLLDALAKVLTLIQRRHIEQVKVALPVVLKVMHAAVSECVEEYGSAAVDLFNAAHGIGNAIQEMCKSMFNKNKDLYAILGLYSLQNIALVSRSRQQDILSACGSVVFQSFKFLKSSGFTYLGLLTGSDVTAAIDQLSKDEDADFVEYFSFAMDGAALSVVWTHMYDDNDMSKYAGEQLELALKEVQGNHMKKWEAINMLKHVLSSIHYPWMIKSHGLNLMLILAGENHVEEINNHVDFTCYAPRVFATLKAIESVMMAAPMALVRKKAFVALKKVISMVPSSQRFDILQALVNNSTSPSLTAILLDLVREEVSRESRRADNDCVEDDGFRGNGLPRWASHALELVELILRPPEGGPPCLPDHSEQVISALNLLRFILIIDSRGERSGKLFQKETLHKVHLEWLTPLRPIAAEIQLENEKDADEIKNEIVCTLNLVQLVLYRCIELVEEKLKGC